MAVQPMQQDSLSMMQPATFDTNDLQSALTRSQQVNGTAGGMRCAFPIEPADARQCLESRSQTLTTPMPRVGCAGELSRCRSR